MSSFTVTEPHPTVAQGSLVRVGRGGYANHVRAPLTTPATGVPSVSKPMPPSTDRKVRTGRGGFANLHSASDIPPMSFDEQYKLQSHIEDSSTKIMGARGGWGNIAKDSKTSSSQRKSSDASSAHSGSSSGSTSSVRSGFLKRLTSISSKGPNP
ncbi:hypothetical protein G7054_g1111 [Neopestalotiopsis clavispora]|nr:hypothetical protein G7054_g1111 [Neopestalotiopsis clavispora]